MSRGNIAVLIIFFLALAIMVIGSVVRLPYAVLSPGPTMNVLGDAPSSTTPLIGIDGAPSYPADGALRFTTVYIAGGPGHAVDAWTVLEAWLDPAQDVVPVDDAFDPNASPQQVEQENALQMQGSQQEATAVALRAIGKKVPTHIVVASVLESSKAVGILKVGDRINSIEGVSTESLDGIREALQKVKPGDPAAVGLTRAGTSLTVQVPTIEVAGGRSALGILIGIDHDFPVKVTISAGDVGGPSAGLMFSLGIYDKLTPGSLTGNHIIAGTGTIDDSGTVGPIGGIRQKLNGAKDDGANFFLAPAANCKEVVGAIPDGLQVFKVGTFNQAVTAVEAIAEDRTASLPRC
ncbi:MAG: PDZ domain-containing protein [Dermatophilaceae bacterium]